MDLHERRFQGEAERLRSPERVALLEVERVVTLSLEGLAATGKQPKLRVLDIGTGTGLFAEAFDARGCSVVGLDPNLELLEIAGSLVPAAEFREGAAEALPFADGSFDLAFLGTVLHEVDDHVAALGEARRVVTQRIAILEWPRVPDEHGPPLEHRLNVDTVLQSAREAGLPGITHNRLRHMDFYLIPL